MPVGSPTTQKPAGGAASSSVTRRWAPAALVSSSCVNQRWTGRCSSIAANSGIIAMAQAAKPFMSEVPRPISRPSCRRSLKGSASHSCPSTGTQSTCAESAAPPATRGPTMACRFAFTPAASRVMRLATPCAASHDCTSCIRSRLLFRLVVSNATSRSSSPKASPISAIPSLPLHSLYGVAWAAIRGGSRHGSSARRGTRRGPRIAVLGLHLEANAFAPPTVAEDFARQCLVRGAAITGLARAAASHLPGEIAGFYRRMDATGPWRPVPLLIAAAPPGGPIEQAVLLDFLDEMRPRPGRRAAAGRRLYRQPRRLLRHRRRGQRRHHRRHGPPHRRPAPCRSSAAMTFTAM